MSDTKASKVDRILRQISEQGKALPTMFDLCETNARLMTENAQVREDNETLKRYLKNQIALRVAAEQKYAALCIRVVEDFKPALALVGNPNDR